MDYAIIFHVSELSRVTSCLNNIRNYLAATQSLDTSMLRVVFNGDGVKGILRSAEHAASWCSLPADNVCLIACQNSLRGLAITPDELIDQVVIVPAGIVELVERQHEGWIYIKP